jgi:hypothetical protein
VPATSCSGGLDTALHCMQLHNWVVGCATALGWPKKFRWVHPVECNVELLDFECVQLFNQVVGHVSSSTVIIGRLVGG